MRPSVFVIVLGLAAAAASQLAAQPQPQPQRTAADAPKSPAAIVRGRVIAGDTGLPLRRAQVRLNSTDLTAGDSHENRVVTSDADGKYEVRDLPAGRYSVAASKAGYVSVSYGQARPRDQPKPINLRDAQIVERIDFTLPRGGVITGRVVDEFGEPLSNVQVGAMRSVGSAPQMYPVRSTTTDDLGEFRLFGLERGDYYVQATWRSQNPLASPDEDRTGYAPTLYPGVIDSKDAQLIPIANGTTASDVVFAMLPIKTARITGTVTDSHGRPMIGSVMAQQNATSGYMSFGAAIRPDGTFVINGLMAGDYTLRAEPTRRESDSEVAILQLTLNGEDVQNLQLVASPRPKAAGRILADPAFAAALMGATLTLNAFPVGPMIGMGPMQPARVAEDLTFTLTAYPGRMRIVMNGLPPGFALRAVRVNGTDVTDVGLEFKAGENIAGVEVEVTNRVTTVSGSVRNARGDAATTYTVVVFAGDPERLQVRMASPDQEGRFKISGLRPGDYYAIAFERMESASGGWDYDRWRQRAVSFSLAEGESKTLDLKLTTSP
jgi:hypothetical protein